MRRRFQNQGEVVSNSKKLAAAIVRKVLADLLDRRGFRHEWDSCDETTKKDIRRSLVTTVEIELNKKGQ